MLVSIYYAFGINFCIPVFPNLGASLTELPIPGKRIVTIRVPYHSTLFILDFSFQRIYLYGLMNECISVSTRAARVLLTFHSQ